MGEMGKLTEVGDGRVCIDGFQYIVKKSELADPEQLKSFTLTLPHGLSAKFVRWTDWKRSDMFSEESISKAIEILRNAGIAVSPFQEKDPNSCPPSDLESASFSCSHNSQAAS
jgi:hypothetical protein